MDSMTFSGLAPILASGVLSSLAIVAISIFFLPRQRNRGFIMLNKFRIVLLSGLSVVFVSLASLMTPTQSGFQQFTNSVTATTLIYLLVITVLTDFRIHKIPTELAWLPAVFGLTALFLSTVTGNAIELNLASIYVIIILAVLPVSAFLSVLLSGGGAADYRVAMSGFLATFWWVTPGSVAVGLIFFILFTVIGRLFFSKKSESGKTMTPAGPAYASLFASAALFSLVFV